MGDKTLKVLFTCLPFESHLRALAPVARTLQSLGHQVTVAAPPSTGDVASARYGFPTVPVGIDWTQEPRVVARIFRALERGNEAFLDELMDNVLVDAAAPSAEALHTIHDDPALRPDLYILDPADLGAAALCSTVGAPAVTLDNGLVGLLYKRLGAQHWERVRESVTHELARDISLPQTVLSPAPPRLFLDPIDELTPAVEVLDYRHANPLRFRERLTDLREWDHTRKSVYVAFGSILTCTHHMRERLMTAYCRVVEAIDHLGLNGLVSVGPILHAELSEYVAKRGLKRIHVVTGISQPLAMKIVDACVTHAGFGTLREAMYSGVGIVAAPICTDGPANAARCDELGVGHHVDFDECDAAEYAEALYSVLTGERAPHVRQIQMEMLSRPAFGIDTLNQIMETNEMMALS